jgi:mono/diheme cytochrome c family protein
MKNMKKKRQKKQPGILYAVLILVIAGGVFLLVRQPWAGRPVVINGVAAPPLPVLDKAKIAKGETGYAQYCAGCHGSNLEGAPNWQRPRSDGTFPPPPHDDSGHTWHHPDSFIIRYTAEGGASYNGTMPGFSNQLTDDDMDDILEFIKSGWSKESREFQWWVTYTQGG